MSPSRPASHAAMVGLRLVLGLLAGVLVGLFGTANHRSLLTFGAAPNVHRFPLGLIIALALTVSAALLIRATAGFTAFAAYGIGWILAVQLPLLAAHSGGDVLIVDPRENLPLASLGIVWAYLGAVLLILAALLPPHWFRPPPDPASPSRHPARREAGLFRHPARREAELFRHPARSEAESQDLGPNLSQPTTPSEQAP